MLVLSRKQGEGIVIDSNITIRFLGVHGRRIRVGVEAPREMSVLREELERDVITTLAHPRPIQAARPKRKF